MDSDFGEVFKKLRTILKNHAGTMSIDDRSPNYFGLVGGKHPKHKTPMPIAWVEVGKSYVGYHLMPVYGHRKLLDSISTKLKARMQGKSCFNFKACDGALFQELEQLTVAGFAAFKKAGYLP